MSANEDFSWTAERDADAIVLQMQAATAVYLNAEGAVVVRQDGWAYQSDEDSIVIIQPSNVEAVARAMLHRAKQSLEHHPKAPEPVQVVQRRRRGDPELPLVSAAE